MSKFQDEFSSNSYEDLLNEYGGESIRSKPVKNQPSAPSKASKSTEDLLNEYGEKKVRATPVKKRVNPIKNQPSVPEKTSNTQNTKGNDISFVPKYNENSFDIDLMNAFEEPIRKNNASVPSFETDTNPRSKGKFTVHIDYAKSFATDVANKVKNVATNVKSNGNTQTQVQNNAEYNPQGKKESFDFNDFAGAALNKFQENRKAFTTFGICILIALIISCCAISCINDVLAINRDGGETIEVILPDNADTSDAIRVLDKAGLIKNSIFCNLFVKVMGFSDDNYLSGIYYFTDDMGVEKMLTRFKTSSTRGALVSITIPEGFTVDQVFQRLEKNNVCTAESLYKVLDTVDFGNEYEFIAKLDDVEDRYCVLEGYLFPATYEFEQGTEPASVIRKFLDAFKKRWTEEYAARATELGMSIDDIISLASIVEKEGNGKSQFVLISSALHNRINRSGLYASLGCDATAKYYTNTIAKRETNIKKLSKYLENYDTNNTRGGVTLRDILPPSAICNPGLDAIEATLYPDNTGYYFFVHDKNGEIYMAKDYDEHRANVRKVEKINAGE